MSESAPIKLTKRQIKFLKIAAEHHGFWAARDRPILRNHELEPLKKYLWIDVGASSVSAVWRINQEGRKLLSAKKEQQE